MDDALQLTHNCYTEDESSLLTQLLNLMESEAITYVILRGYNFLPYKCVSAGTNDIDILVDATSFEKALGLLESLGFTRPCEPSKIQTRQAPATNVAIRMATAIRHPIIAIRWLGSKLAISRQDQVLPQQQPAVSVDAEIATYVSLVHHNVKIDVWKHLGHKSLILETLYRVDPEIEREMLESRRLFNNLFYIPSPPHEIAHLAARIILDKEGKVPGYYEQQLSHLLNELKNNPEYLKALQNNLERMFYKAGNLVMQKLLNKELGMLRDSLLQFQNY